MTAPDFPAAHSMDTEWFAVDADGNVAIFETGEQGAAPVAWADGTLDQGSAGAAVQELPIGGEAVQRPAGLHWFREGSTSPVIVHVRDASALAELISSGRATRVTSERSEAFRLQALDPALAEQLHASGTCLDCRSEDDDEFSLRAGERGLFRYQHFDDGHAAPYQLCELPSRPIRLEDLPEDLREGAVRFDGRFGETPFLQPIGRWRCEAWGTSWLAEDGKTVRPVPGREPEYAEELAAMRKFQPELVFEDPSPGTEPRIPTGAAVPPAKPWWKLW
jgi:hypothetical protein